MASDYNTESVFEHTKSIALPYGALNQDIWFMVAQQLLPSKDDQRPYVPYCVTSLLATNKSIGWLTAKCISTAGLSIRQSAHGFMAYAKAITQLHQPEFQTILKRVNLVFYNHVDVKVAVQVLNKLDRLGMLKDLELELEFRTMQTVIQKVQTTMKEPIQIPEDLVEVYAQGPAPRELKMAARAILAGRPLRPEIHHTITIQSIESRLDECEGWEQIQTMLYTLKAKECSIIGLRNRLTAEVIRDVILHNGGGLTNTD